MIRTWVFFTAGGLFTAFYSNAVRKYPLLRSKCSVNVVCRITRNYGNFFPPSSEPQLHLICTGVGCYLGYLAHHYEENSEERVRLLMEKHRHAPAQWANIVKQPKSR